jgi:hypothetical protein
MAEAPVTPPMLAILAMGPVTGQAAKPDQVKEPEPASSSPSTAP